MLRRLARLARLAKKGYRAGKHIQRFGEQVLDAEQDLEAARQQLLAADGLVSAPTYLKPTERVQVSEAIRQGIAALETLQRGAQAAKRRVGAE